MLLNHKENHDEKPHIGNPLYLVIQLLLVLSVGAFVINKIATPLGNFIFYTFVFYRFLISKRIVFWVAVMFVILNNPWGLFYFNPYEWYFRLTSKVGVSYASMYGILFILKIIIFSKRKQKLIKDNFIPFYKPMGFYVIFLVIWSFAFGNTIVSLFNLLQFLPAFLLFYAVPRMINKYELFSFNKIIFLFSIIHFIGSFFEILWPGIFMPLIFFGPPLTGIAYTEELIRFVGGITIHLYTMIVAQYYLGKRDSSFPNWYLLLLILLSYVFILNSATRGWMIASSFLIVSSFTYYMLRIKRSIRTVVIVAIISLVLIGVIPDSFKRNLFAAFNRLETMEAIIEGDFTAEGTLSRLTERGPTVLTKFPESPILGFGYSRVSAEYYDGHVGNHSLLLMGGIVGLSIVWLTALSIVWYFFRVDGYYPGNGYFVFALAFITILIIHSSSRTLISFYMPVDAAFLLGLIFNHFNSDFAVVRQARVPEELFRKTGKGRP